MNPFPDPLSLFGKHWKWCIITGLVIALALANQRADDWKQQAALEKASHDLTVAGYRAAADKAKADDLANVIRVQAERKASDEKVVKSYEVRLADSNARYDRLRKQAEAYSRDPANTNMSASMDATCIAYAGTGCQNIPSLLKAAQDNTDQLIALQDAVRGQGMVEP